MVELVLSTFPNKETAASIGRKLVEEKWAACVNILPEVQSIYVWQEQLEEQSEVMAIFKVSPAIVTIFMERLKSLHPYEVPEILSVTPEKVLPAYAQWVTASCSDPQNHSFS